MAERPFVVGIGNEWRRDDGVGPFVARALADEGWETLAHPGDGAGLIDLFARHTFLILVDATRSGAAPGTLVSFDAIDKPLPAEFFHYSTHRFGLAEAVETARALDQLPPQLIVHGIEGADFSSGQGLSQPVSEAAERLLSLLRK